MVERKIWRGREKVGRGKVQREKVGRGKAGRGKVKGRGKAGMVIMEFGGEESDEEKKQEE